MRLSAKTVVITGGGRGIGRGLAGHLAGLGAAVVINDNGVDLHGRPEDDGLADRVAADIRSSGGRSVGCGDSIAEPSTGVKLVDLAIEQFGTLDAWFHCATITRDRMLFKMSDEEWGDVIHNNLSGAFYGLRAALSHMRQKRAGRVVNLISTAGLIGNFGQANYAAAKAGLFALTRIAALEMQKYGVTVNCVAPFARTRMTDSIPSATPEQKAYLERARQAKVEHVVPLLTWLAGDLSDGVTGQLFGARGCEVFLFSQPRPIRTISRPGGWSVEQLADEIDKQLRPHFVPLETDLTLFDTEPVL